MQEEVNTTAKEYTVEWNFSKPAFSELEATRRLEKMVRAYIDTHELTHAQFCAASGDLISRNQLQPLLGGERRTVSMWMMTALARAMNLPPQVVLGRCGLAYSTSDRPYAPDVEKLAILFDQATVQLPDDCREELVERGTVLINEILEKAGKSPIKA